MKNRVKLCKQCNMDFPVMYRLQYKNPKEWVFVCKDCLPGIKKNNPAYTYGGTWKK